MNMPHGEDLYAAIILCIAVTAIWGSLLAVVLLSVFS
jgi:hypothetical protein